MSDWDRVVSAFRRARGWGFRAVISDKCCQTCAWAAIRREESPKGVTPTIFIHTQDHEAFNSAGELSREMYVSHQTLCPETFHKLVRIFEGAGLALEWSGQQSERLSVRKLAGKISGTTPGNRKQKQQQA